jgi:hypothetical protein
VTRVVIRLVGMPAMKARDMGQLRDIETDMSRVPVEGEEVRFGVYRALSEGVEDIVAHVRTVRWMVPFDGTAWAEIVVGERRAYR